MKTCTACKQLLDREMFSRHRRHSDGRQYECKACRSAASRHWWTMNKDKANAKTLIYNHKEGSGVYETIYPSGIYIGSGWIADRRRKHLNGSARIGKSLGEIATEFKVLLICSIDKCSFYEQFTISQYGIESLLNKNRALL